MSHTSYMDTYTYRLQQLQRRSKTELHAGLHPPFALYEDCSWWDVGPKPNDERFIDPLTVLHHSELTYI